MRSLLIIRFIINCWSSVAAICSTHFTDCLALLEQCNSVRPETGHGKINLENMDDLFSRQCMILIGGIFAFLASISYISSAAKGSFSFYYFTINLTELLFDPYIIRSGRSILAILQSKDHFFTPLYFSFQGM
ncbi:hypothetical protein K501DRAFT_277330 [Backusella circina FSU 941]|nr:hypothetical protein K501DRAFT_277330 [Backusella circina FSU 941]